MDNKYIIETKNLTKQYGSQKSVADLNIHVQKGRIYGLLGRNGAGKTTTMKMLLGLTKPTSGEVKIWGKSLQGNEKKLLPRIGSLIESPGFYPNLTATENLRIFATLRGVPNSHAIKDALDLVGLPYKDKKLFQSSYFSFLYSSSLTGSSHSVELFSPGTSIARCENHSSGAAPCQCLTPVGILMQSPGFISTASLPSS